GPYPSLTEVSNPRGPLHFAQPMVGVYSLSWLSAPLSHGGRLFPTFHRVDLFTALGLGFHLSPSLSIHGLLGFPIGWDRVYTAIVIGFSLRL
ncbi:MAG: hypothetical protein NUW06_08435, partial [Candidatus Acetothermia bacterium]|nr:hypothetical protein [Candidatus Acetothermia bacterium]